MYIIPHTKDMITKSFEKATRLGPLNNSITQGRGNAAGYLGEEAVASYLGAEIVSSDAGTNKFNHDLILADGTRAEIKSKRRTVAPKDSYEVSVVKSSLHQKPDLYIFVSLHFASTEKRDGVVRYKDLKDVWLVGQKDYKDYLEQASFMQFEGKNYYVPANMMLNMYIKDLEEVVK
tara:strand:- start:577 stop:1104 length:528 start_codon:yes stop_codon:yes gene_type:complete